MIAVARMRATLRTRGGRSTNMFCVAFMCVLLVATAGVLYPEEPGTSYGVLGRRWASPGPPPSVGLRRGAGGGDDQGDEDGHHAETKDVVDADGERERGLVGECVGAAAQAHGVRHYARQRQADGDAGAEERECPGAQADAPAYQ